MHDPFNGKEDIYFYYSFQLCQLADLEQITEFSIAYHAEGKRLLTMSVTDSKVRSKSETDGDDVDIGIYGISMMMMIIIMMMMMLIWEYMGYP